MNKGEKALLLIGSPRGMKSTSASLGNYLLERLSEKGLTTETIHIQSLFKSDAKQQEFIINFEQANLLILSFPLYVDTLPAPVIRVFELINENRYGKEQISKQKLLAIANCGFPESEHNRVALTICEQIARELGLEWLGGLALGMGGAISGKPIKQIGSMGNNIKKSLDLVSESLIQDEDIPEKAFELMETPLLPGKWMYTAIASISWRVVAFKNKVYSKLNDKPYEKSFNDKEN